MSNKTVVFLVRHGQTEWNIEKRFQGHKNSSLTIKGKDQALQVKKNLSRVKIHKAYVSPLQRAKDTINIILDGREIEIIQKNNFKEINLGPWEGKTREEMKEFHPDEYDHFWNKQDKFFLSGAETYYQLQQRIVAELDDIFQNDLNKNILIVTHWIAIKVATAHYASIPINRLSSLTDIGNGEFLTLVSKNGNVTINGL